MHHWKHFHSPTMRFFSGWFLSQNLLVQMEREQRSSSPTLHFEFISNNVMRWNKKRVKFMFPQRIFCRLWQRRMWNVCIQRIFRMNIEFLFFFLSFCLMEAPDSDDWKNDRKTIRKQRFLWPAECWGKKVCWWVGMNVVQVIGNLHLFKGIHCAVKVFSNKLGCWRWKGVYFKTGFHLWLYLQRPTMA